MHTVEDFWVCVHSEMIHSNSQENGDHREIRSQVGWGLGTSTWRLWEGREEVWDVEQLEGGWRGE